MLVPICVCMWSTSGRMQGHIWIQLIILERVQLCLSLYSNLLFPLQPILSLASASSLPHPFHPPLPVLIPLPYHSTPPILSLPRTSARGTRYVSESRRPSHRVVYRSPFCGVTSADSDSRPVLVHHAPSLSRHRLRGAGVGATEHRRLIIHRRRPATYHIRILQVLMLCCCSSCC